MRSPGRGIAFVLVVLALASAASPQTPIASPSARARTGRITVVVTGFRNATGQAGVTLFRTSAGFPEEADRATARAWRPIEGGKATATFEGVPLGRCAVLALHDENANEKFDKNFLGIPKEGYGVSNGARHKLRAPRFEEALVSCDPDGTTIEIQLGY